jgi:hypothetical protein
MMNTSIPKILSGIDTKLACSPETNQLMCPFEEEKKFLKSDTWMLTPTFGRTRLIQTLIWT